MNSIPKDCLQQGPTQNPQITELEGPIGSGSSQPSSGDQSEEGQAQRGQGLKLSAPLRQDTLQPRHPLQLPLLTSLNPRCTPPSTDMTPPLEMSKTHLMSLLHPKWLCVWSLSSQEMAPLFFRVLEPKPWRCLGSCHSLTAHI